MVSEVVPTISYTTVRLKAQKGCPALKLICHEQESLRSLPTKYWRIQGWTFR
jgi:hypothetical protein